MKICEVNLDREDVIMVGVGGSLRRLPKSKMEEYMRKIGKLFKDSLGVSIMVVDEDTSMTVFHKEK